MFLVSRNISKESNDRQNNNELICTPFTFSQHSFQICLGACVRVYRKGNSFRNGERIVNNKSLTLINTPFQHLGIRSNKKFRSMSIFVSEPTTDREKSTIKKFMFFLLNIRIIINKHQIKLLLVAM